MIFKREQLAYEKTYPFKEKKLNYRILGDPKTKPIILVHGAMESRDWDDFEKEISKYYQAFVLDLPGFGASDSLDIKYSVDVLAESLCAFISIMSLEKAPIIALSMGTLVTVRAAANSCTQGKIILGGMPLALENNKVGMANKLPLFIKRFAMKLDIAREKVLLPLLDSALNERSSTSAQEKLNRMKSTHERTISDIDLTKEAETNLTSYYPLMKNKHILLYGEKDPLQFAAQKNGLKYTIIPGAEHNLFRTNPKTALRVILDFLKHN